MKKSLYVLASLVALLPFAAGQVQAGVITFETHVPNPDFGNPQFQDGFRFDFDALGWGITLTEQGGAPYTTNGTTRLLASGGVSLASAYVDVALVSGVPFSLNGFDAATAFPDLGDGSLTVTGQLFGGGTVSQTVPLTTSFNSLSLPPTFANLTSVRFQDDIPGGFRVGPGISLDNIVYNEVFIPEPASLSLLGLGLLAVARKRRRR